MLRFKLEEVNDANGGGASGSGGGVAAQNIADGNSVQGTSAQPVGDSGGNAGSGAGDGKSWLESLPDEIKHDPSLAVFKDVSGLAKSFVSAQKMIGAEKVIIPNEKSTEEDWNAFYQKLGRPESPDKYEIKAPDGQALDESVSKTFRETAFKLGLSPKQVAGLAEWNFGAVSAAQEAAKNAELNQVRESINEYAKKLGGDEKYKARVDEARIAVRSLATPELNEFLRTSGLGSRPEMIEFFAQLKGMMAEDKIRDGTGVSFQGEDPAILQQEINELETKMFSDLSNTNRQSWVEQRAKLYERLNAARRPA